MPSKSSTQPLFASMQCDGEEFYDGQLTKEICSPSASTVVEQVRYSGLKASAVEKVTMIKRGLCHSGGSCEDIIRVFYEFVLHSAGGQLDLMAEFLPQSPVAEKL